jgi:aryl-alcohol dehydrogenase-like predicted oxidoreductase
MKGKITLGTANFGLTYGIANKRMLPEREALLILEKAARLGLSSVDTARGYGEAEKVLGTFFRQHGKLFEVVTKLPGREYASPGDVSREVELSLENLKIDRIDVLLLHNFDTLQRFKDVLTATLEEYVRNGMIGRYGVSIYHPHEAKNALESGLGLAAVQFPLNIFDRRFLKGDLLANLRKACVRLDARSAFLQGLFFLPPQGLSEQFDPAKEKLKRLSAIALENGLAVGALALLFAASCDVDHVVLGVDSAGQLEMNLKWLTNGSADGFAQIKHELDELEVDAEDVILPYRWKS